MLAAVLDQAAGDQIGFLGILRGPRPGAVVLDLALDLGREALPHQLLGEIDRRRDQHQAGDGGRRAAWARRASSRTSSSASQPPMEEPITHLRPAAEGVEHRDAFLEPAADRAVGEVAARFAMAGIVEAHHGAAVLARPAIERLGLGALHVGLEAAEPEQARRRCRARSRTAMRRAAEPVPTSRNFRQKSFIRRSRPLRDIASDAELPCLAACCH